MTGRSPDVPQTVAFPLHDLAYARTMPFEPEARPRPASGRGIVIEVARLTPRGEAVVIRTEPRADPPAPRLWPVDDDD